MMQRAASHPLKWSMHRVGVILHELAHFLSRPADDLAVPSGAPSAPRELSAPMIEVTAREQSGGL